MVLAGRSRNTEQAAEHTGLGLSTEVHFFWEGAGMGRHSREPGGGRTTKEKSKPSPATQGSDYKVPRAAKGTEIGMWGCGRTKGRLVGHMHGSTQWSGLDVDSRGLLRC